LSVPSNVHFAAFILAFTAVKVLQMYEVKKGFLSQTDEKIRAELTAYSPHFFQLFFA
jgi:hypothetical protein